MRTQMLASMRKSTHTLCNIAMKDLDESLSYELSKTTLKMHQENLSENRERMTDVMILIVRI